MYKVEVSVLLDGIAVYDSIKFPGAAYDIDICSQNLDYHKYMTEKKGEQSIYDTEDYQEAYLDHWEILLNMD